MKTLLAAIVVLLACVTSIPAHDGHHTYMLVEDIDTVPPEIRRWIERLTDKQGRGCCSTADGYPAEAEYDRDSNSYRVRIGGTWYAVPDVAVITEGNRIGYAMVWYYIGEDEQVAIRCFIAGTGA